jgi:hypothetical protein
MLTELKQGWYYEKPAGEIVKVIKAFTKHPMVTYRDQQGNEYTTGTAVALAEWKERDDLSDFPSPEDKALPYAFDMLWGIKRYSQLQKVLSEGHEDLDQIKLFMATNCIVIPYTERVTEKPWRAYVAVSASGEGWNNDLGWVDIKSATIFTEEQTRHYALPCAGDIWRCIPDLWLYHAVNVLYELVRIRVIDAKVVNRLADATGETTESTSYLLQQLVRMRKGLDREIDRAANTEE